ncbi:MAG: hypothetical protein PUK64_05795 [bacterium]|nr:hypothetical protein [bacterium]MDD7722485.1 hypothetical protein [bacterium]MDY4103015.1 hypothetical protein [Parabacteroides sp.]
MASTEDLHNYLLAKHRGGENNLKGGLYEEYYAVFQIVSCLAKYKHELDAVSFQAQLEDTFVDDLLIAHPDVNIYHQLKNRQTVSWGSTKTKGDIAFDFAHQIEVCQERDEAFALKLIYSAKESEVTDVPAQIKSHSQAEWFPYQKDINQLVIISNELKDALRRISSEGVNATDDVLANIAIVVLGAWKKTSATKTRVTLSSIVSVIEVQKQVNISLYPDGEISEVCKRILDAIDGIEYHISGRMFYWCFGLLKGSCPWPDKMEAKIIEANPKTKLELIALL